MNSAITGYDETSEFKKILRDFIENMGKKQGYDVCELSLIHI